MAKKRRISKSTRRRLQVFGIFSLFCIIYFFASLGYEIYQIYDLKKQQTELKEEYKKLKQEAKDLEIEIEELNDPEYLAKYARENYSYSKDGEYIIKLQDKEEKIEDVNNALNKNYVVIGLITFIGIVFIYILKKGNKKSK